MDEAGRVVGSGSLTGPAMDFIARAFGPLPPLHRVQVSAVYPGYPRPRAGESAAAFRYRRDRNAAHPDGVKPVGPGRRRRIEECHAFLLGLLLTETTETDARAAPLVVWEHSPEVMRATLRAALANNDPADWHRVDVTRAYRGARRQAFDACKRICLHVRPGEACLLHRLALHGVVPWAGSATAPPDGRVIACLRPLMPGTVADWLDAP